VAGVDTGEVDTALLEEEDHLVEKEVALLAEKKIPRLCLEMLGC